LCNLHTKNGGGGGKIVRKDQNLNLRTQIEHLLSVFGDFDMSHHHIFDRHICHISENYAHIRRLYLHELKNCHIFAVANNGKLTF